MTCDTTRTNTQFMQSGHVRTYLHTCTHTYMYTYILHTPYSILHTYKYTHIHTHAHTDIQTHTHTCTRTHIHTYTHTRTSQSLRRARIQGPIQRRLHTTHSQHGYQPRQRHTGRGHGQWPACSTFARVKRYGWEKVAEEKRSQGGHVSVFS